MKFKEIKNPDAADKLNASRIRYYRNKNDRELNTGSKNIERNRKDIMDYCKGFC